MKFIIVDDSEYKVNSMKDSINELFLAEVISFNYGNDALNYLTKEETFEDSIYLILDMNFPSLSGGGIKPDNGLGFMHSLSMREIDRKIQTIIFSSDEVDLKRFKEFDNVIGSIKYDCFVSTDYSLMELIGLFGNSLNSKDLTDSGKNMFSSLVHYTVKKVFGGTNIIVLTSTSDMFHSSVLKWIYAMADGTSKFFDYINKQESIVKLSPIESEKNTKHIEEVSKRIKNSPEKAIKLIASKKSSGRYERNSKKNNMNKPMWR